LPRSRSRRISRVHRSPTRSRAPATGHGDRGPALLDPDPRAAASGAGGTRILLTSDLLFTTLYVYREVQSLANFKSLDEERSCHRPIPPVPLCPAPGSW